MSQKTQIAYKLCRQRKNLSLGPLFINQRQIFELGTWLQAGCFPTNGFAVRQGWHCSHAPFAPHLTEKDRVWLEVLIEDFEEFKRPANQGGMWLIAQRMKIQRILSQNEVVKIRQRLGFVKSYV